MKKFYTAALMLMLSFAAKAQFPAPYCAEAFPLGVEPITSVKFGTINNTSPAAIGGVAHQNFTAITTTVARGSAYAIEVKGNTDGNYADGVRAFIDFNNNGVFTDAGETFTIGALINSTGTDAIAVTSSITIPASANIGSTRMRIIKLADFYPIPCNTEGYGEAEDYTINITAPACASPTNLTFSSVTIPNASITWTAAAGVSSYEYAITTSSTPPASGTVTTSTTATTGGLPANTPLFAYVRSVCSPGVFTAWIQKAFLSNDDCSGAFTINPYAGPVNGATIGATQSLAPTTCTGFASSTAYDVWYRATALSNGSFTVSVSSTTGFDAILGIYHGTCAALVFDTCRDNTVSNGTESITFLNAIAGTNYFIRVYRYKNSTDSTGTFTITATGPALPVTGLVLSGTRNSSKAQLNWKTLTEINNAGFELQRSADGQYFTGIATIASKANGGNSTAAITYSVDDVKPFSGANYYRLKQTDKDGKISYSNIVYLKGVAVSNLTLSAVYPNPTRDVLKAAVLSPAAESITFIITDMMGKTISRQVSTVISGDNVININVANLPSGSYLLKAVCRNGCETTYQKFTKQ